MKQVTNIFVSLALVLAYLSSNPVLAENTSSSAIKFGSVAMDIPAEMHRRLTPLTSYLSKWLGKPVTLKLAPDMKTAISDLATGQVDFAYLTPVAYIHSHTKGNTRLVVKTLTNDRDSFQLMIAVRKNSPFNQVEDLIGKRFAFGDKSALLQRAVVVGANLPLNKLGSYEFIGHYDNIVRGVLNHSYDAGILKDTKYFQWQNKGIRLLYSSPKLPPYNIAAKGDIDDKLLATVRKAFLNLNINNANDKKVIKSLDKKYDGFVATSDKEYDVIRQLIKPFIK